jgi:hypothetical protein
VVEVIALRGFVSHKAQAHGFAVCATAPESVKTAKDSLLKNGKEIKTFEMSKRKSVPHILQMGEGKGKGR